MNKIMCPIVVLCKKLKLLKEDSHLEVKKKEVSQKTLNNMKRANPLLDKFERAEKLLDRDENEGA